MFVKGQRATSDAFTNGWDHFLTPVVLKFRAWVWRARFVIRALEFCLAVCKPWCVTSAKSDFLLLVVAKWEKVHSSTNCQRVLRQRPHRFQEPHWGLFGFRLFMDWICMTLLDCHSTVASLMVLFPNSKRRFSPPKNRCAKNVSI